MSAPRTDLAPPKDDPFTLEQLKEYDGKTGGKPIYVAIKGSLHYQLFPLSRMHASTQTPSRRSLTQYCTGTVFDVSNKKEMYGAGASYNIFAGKDGSRGLGLSSLKPEDAVPDWSTLGEAEKKVLDQWYGFFSVRYNIVGKVTDLPEAVAGKS